MKTRISLLAILLMSCIGSWAQETDNVATKQKALSDSTVTDSVQSSTGTRSGNLPSIEEITTETTAGFVPTTMQGVQAADPSSKINLITPPTANSHGSANLAYELEMPPVRNGMSPPISVQYSSDGGEGLLGEGWDLPIPTITVDTRWGVPRYDTSKETETYLIDGEMLAFTMNGSTATLPHRTEGIARMANRHFYRRRGGDFHRIIRKGDSIDNYHWEVTDASGTVYTYGGTVNSRMAGFFTDASGHSRRVTAEWRLSRIEEIHGDFITFEYHADSTVAVMGGNIPAIDLYPCAIRAYNRGDTIHPHTVVTLTYSSVKNTKRTDARFGFLTTSRHLLTEASVNFLGNALRSYVFDYSEGKFGRKLLTRITHRDQNNDTVSWQSFTYYDDVATNNTYYNNKKDTVSLNDAGLSVDFTVPSAGAAKKTPSALGGEVTSSKGVGLYVGVGFTGMGVFKENTGGVQFDYNTDTTVGMETFVDINGDGLPDKVYRKDGMVSFCAATKNGDTLAYRNPIALMGIDGFLKTKGATRTWGGQAVAGNSSSAASVGLSMMKSNSKTSCYLTDINGDGLPDMVKDGKVWFNHIEVNGDGIAVPTFTESSADTPNPIYYLRDADTSAMAEDSLQTDTLIMTSPLIDVVRVWEAPRDGTVDISGFSQLMEQGETSGTADGVALSIEMHGDTLMSQVIAASDHQYHDFAIDSLQVAKGDRVYFRAQSGNVPDADGTDDEVWWPMFIEYRDVGRTGQEPDGEDILFSSCDGFQRDDESYTGIKGTGTFTLGGRVSKWATEGDITLQIIGRDSTNTTAEALYSLTIPRDSTYVGELAVTVPNPHHLTSIRMEMSSPAYAGLRNVGWFPSVAYIDNGDTITQECGVKYHVFSEELQHGSWWRMPTSTKVYYVKPRLAMSRWPGDVTLTVKSGNGVHYQKTYHTEAELQSDSTRVTFPSSYMWLRAEFTCGDTLGLADLDSARVDLNIASRSYRLTPDVFARKSEDVLGVMYRGWGAFCYNASQGRCAVPIDTTLLCLPQDSASADPMLMPFVQMRVSNRGKLLGPSDNTYLNGDDMSPGRLTEQSVRWVNPLIGGSVAGRDNPNGTGAAAVTQICESTGTVTQAGMNSLTLNTSEGSARTRVTMMDMNGDGYPDIVTDGKVQYTSPLGGLSGEILGSGHGIESSNDGSSIGVGGVPIASFSVNVRNLFKGKGAESNKALTIAGKASVSDNVGIRNDRSRATYIDINGDGLPDAIGEDGKVYLNMGYSFSPTPITIPADAMQGGTSTNMGVGGGFNICSGSISGGISLSVGTNSTGHALLDVNGDGLPDIVTSDGGDFTVRLNDGMGFASPTNWTSDIGIESSSSTSSSANVAGTVSIPAFGIRIVTNPSASVGKSVHRTTETLADIDGDGFLDVLSSDSESSIFANYSTIGRTNKLKTVTNILGGTFTLNYNHSKPTYGLPGGKWVMKSVVVDDGINDDGSLTRTEFAYSDGVRDRREREFLGFGEVLVKEMDTVGDSLYRQTAYRYDVAGGYHTCANLLSTSVMDAAGRKYVETENVYEAYTVMKIGTFYKTVAQGDATAMWTPLRYSRNLRYEGASEGVVMSSDWYKYKEGMFTFGEMEKRRHRTGGGMSSDGTGSYDYETAYAYKTNLTGNYSSIPSSITTTGNDGTAHKVTALYGAPCPTDITQTRQFIDASHHADTDYERDSVGNVTKVTLPDNGQGQRMFYRYEYEDTMGMYVKKVTDVFNLNRKYQDRDFRYGIHRREVDPNHFSMATILDGLGRLSSATSPKELNRGVPYTISCSYHPQATVGSDGITAPAYATTLHYDTLHVGDPIATVTFVDGFGRVTQVKKDAAVCPDDGSAGGVDMQVVSGRVVYDAFGRAVREYHPTTDALGNATVFKPSFDAVAPTRTEYDILDRPIRVTYPDNAVETIAYSMENGLLKAVVTDARGNKSATYTDGDDRVVMTIMRHASNEGLPIVTTYTYDALGRLSSVTDTEGNATTHSYDWLDRRVETNHPASGLTTWMYAPAGNILSMQRGNREEARYLYWYDRLVGISYPNHPEDSVSYTYGGANDPHNGCGRVVSRSDGSGTLDYKYDQMGNVIEEDRVVVVPNQAVARFVTQYDYDSFGRLLGMTYPDNETVSYLYDSGGNVTRIKISTSSTDFVSAVGYDRFGARVRTELGNGTVERLTHSPTRRWLNGVWVGKGTTVLVNSSYATDAVGNITSITGYAPTPSTPGGMGGPPRFCYYYDSLDRLVAATGDYSASDGRYGRYDLSMSYDDLWRVTSKSLDLWRHTAPHSPRQYAGYSLSYGYGTDDGTRFRLSTIAETHYRAENDTVGARRQTFHRYQYDGSGNLTYEESGRPVAGGAVNWKSDERKLLWDAENRLRALDENGYVSTYVYDADGERVVKQHGGNRGLYVNSAGRDSLTETTAFTLYVNPYVTWTEGGKYVKHVYMGGSRVASRLGVAHLMGNNPIAALGGVLPGHVLKDSMQKAAVVTSYGVFGVPYGGEDRTAVLPYSNEPGNFLGDFTDPDSLEGRQYFYHPDHLGSSTVITDEDGNVVQHIEYMPYGEVFMEETGDTWNTPYKFNGKEYDEETGLYYYGARYLDPKLSIWYGTDPKENDYPGISTYCYTMGNPVKFIDPDGEDIIICYTDGNGNNRKFRFSGFHGNKSLNIPDNQYVKDFFQAYLYNAKNGGGQKTIEAANNPTIKIYLTKPDDGKSEYYNYDRKHVVYWESRQGLETTEGGRQSAATILEHEMDHGVDDLNNHKAHNDRRRILDPQYENKEEHRVITGSERKTALANKESIRRNHKGKSFKTESPISIKPINSD